MTVQRKPRPSVPSSSGQSKVGNGLTGEGAEGAKNLWKKNKSCQQKLNICTYNTRTLVGEDKLIDLENELEHINWDIVGLSEIKRRGEELVELRSRSMFYYKGRDNDSNSGVGFLVNKNIKDKTISYRNSGDRIAQIIIQLTERYRLQIIQVYAPTTNHDEEEVIELYEEVYKLIEEEKTHFKIVMGDFNAQVGKKDDEKETSVGNFGYKKRNERGDLLVDFAEANKLK
ncbi:craniofacial development protein 2-like [Amphiura filiformis]|uniref:craniofacial development protein 2-like n=1 Tax=Amphiura filiformis TaxID=82378 RepID=UPI003B21478A